MEEIRLDVGCGPFPKIGFIGVDNNPAYNPDFLWDASDLKFPDCSVSEVYSRRCLQHVPDDLGALQEIFRVLRHGGKCTVIFAGFPGWLFYKLGLSGQSGKYPVFHFYHGKKLRWMFLVSGFNQVKVQMVFSKKLGFDYKVSAVKI